MTFAAAFDGWAAFIQTYAVVFLIIALLLGVRALLGPVTRVWAHLARELCLAVILYFVYYLVRGMVKDQVDVARERANALIHFERRLGIFLEPTIQQHALHHDLLIRFVNWVYVWWFWPTIIFGLCWLYLYHRDEYGAYRNAILISGAMGLVVFALFPLAPPRFIDGLGIADTVRQRSVSSHVLLPQGLANKYAAMPSLHVGWTFLMGTALMRFGRHAITRVGGGLLPICMFTSVVVTGNHYILDGLVGMAFTMIALAAAYELEKWRAARTATFTPVPAMVPVRAESGGGPRSLA